MDDVRAALTELVTYFTVVVMNLRMRLRAHYMCSPVSEFVSVRVKERDDIRARIFLTDLHMHAQKAPRVHSTRYDLIKHVSRRHVL